MTQQEESPLLASGNIGGLEARNRIVKAPQLTHTGRPDGSVSERTLDHYRKLAEGGTGTVIVEYSYVDDDAAKSAHGQLSAANDSTIPGLSQLAKTIQSGGANACLQLAHCGRQKFMAGGVDFDPEAHPVKAASAVPWEELHEMGGDAAVPEPLTRDEIHDIVDAFGDAALRGQIAGFDMVEIHAAHGYLLTNFLSPRTNDRDDEYGGSLENRTRILEEIIENVRAKVGPEYPIQVRLNGDEYEPDGVTLDETLKVSKRLEAMGVDSLHVSGGNHHQMIHQVTPHHLDQAHNTYAAEEVKQVVDLPVVASGSINTPEIAEGILDANRADFVSMGRPLLADPDLPNKIAEGRTEEISPCIRCNDGCLDRTVMIGKTVNCSVNPATGSGATRAELLDPVDTSARVAVVGGGVAGMEAARTAAERGHNVTLYERDELGGYLGLVANVDFKSEYGLLVDRLKTAVRRADRIDVVYEEPDADALTGPYDRIVLATGSEPLMPDVADAPDLDPLTWHDVLDADRPIGDRVAVVGGDSPGIDLTLHLLADGKSVSVVQEADDLLTDVGMGAGQGYQHLLEAYSDGEFETFVDARLDGASNGNPVVSIDGEERLLDVDDVVVAAGRVPHRPYADHVTVDHRTVHRVGDCATPGRVYDAVHDGFETANRL